MKIVRHLRRAFGLEPVTPDAPHPDRLTHLVNIVNEQSPQWWEAVNESRRRRGEPPLHPRSGFRPSSLIDPRDGRYGDV